MPALTSRRGVGLRIALAVFAIHALSPNAMVTDSIRVVPVAQRIVTHADLAVTPHANGFGDRYGLSMRDGRAYPLFPWTISVFLVPAVVVVDAAHAAGLGRGAASYGGGSPDDWPLEVVSMSLVVALAAMLVFLIGVEVADSDDERARRRLGIAAAVVFAFGTSAWSTASRAAWQHGPSLLFVSAALLLAVRSRRAPLAAGWFGAALAAALVVRPTNVMPVTALAFWALYAHRRRALRAIPAALAVLVPFVIVNLLAYHALLPPYFTGTSLVGKTQLLTALAGNLWSPARGILVFSPIVLLAPIGLFLRRRAGRLDALDAAVTVAVLGQWLVISRLPHWWGGFEYGPRLFTDAVPMLVVLALPVIDRCFDARPRRVWIAAPVAVLAGWSVFANAEGALFRSSTCWNITPNIDQHPNRLWSWSDSQVLAGVRGVARHGLASELSPGGYADTALTTCPGATS